MENVSKEATNELLAGIMERQVRRMFIIIIILIIGLIATNVGWLIYEIHDQVVKIIEEIKRTREVPEGMQTLYDYLHERQIKWAAKIKAKQEAYK